jgi:hypothetical protein
VRVRFDETTAMGMQIRKLTSVVATLVALQFVTLATVIGLSLFLRYELKQYVSDFSGIARQTTAPDSIENWQGLVREHNAARGDENAAVVVIEFSDFQCPFCKQFTDGTRRELMDKYGDNLRMVFKHYPLEQIHPHAMTAAIAAQCARRHRMFWEFHEALFGQPDALDVASIIRLAETLDLPDGFAECLISESTRAEVEQDIRDALEAGVRGTPTFIINGEVLAGSPSETVFTSAIRRAGLFME